MYSVASIRTALEGRLRLALPTAVRPSEAASSRARTVRPPVPWRAVAKQAAIFWLVTRLAYVLVTYFAVLLGMTAKQVDLRPGSPEFVSVPPDLLMQSWLKWDGLRYLDIAQHGYHIDALAAFFPLYPLLIKIVTLVLGASHGLAAALVVSNLGTLAAFIGVGLLAAGEEPFEASEAGTRAIRVLAAFPLAFFLTAPYSDGIFLALAAFSLLFARRGVWRWAAACALLAALTRLTSIILILPLLWEYGRQHEWHQGRWREQLRSLPALIGVAAVAGAVPVGIGLYMAYLKLRFGHPLILLYVERWYWNHQSMPPWQALGLAVSRFFAVPGWSYWQGRILVDLGPLLLMAALTLLAARRMPVAFTLYMVGLLGLSIYAPILVRPDVLISAGRYMLAGAPIFVVLGKWTKQRPWLDLLVVSGGFMVQAILATYFLTGYWLV